MHLVSFRDILKLLSLCSCLKEPPSRIPYIVIRLKEKRTQHCPLRPDQIPEENIKVNMKVTCVFYAMSHIANGQRFPPVSAKYLPIVWLSLSQRPM